MNHRLRKSGIIEKNRRIEMENTFTEFTARMVEKVRGTYPEGWRIETMEVLQTNDVVYTGLRVSKGNSSVSPVVYLEKFYAAYLEGVPFETLASEVIGVLKENPQLSFRF